jgi:caffeoyl-CoA O-methyltransferase
MDFLPPEIERYAEEHTTPQTDVLADLAAETRARLRAPQMLTGPVEARFLELLVHAKGMSRVLEIGTYSGYSAISMAAALPPGGRIDTCEVDPEHAEVARRYIERAGYSDRITVHLAPALDTIAQLEGPFDFVFIDADKVNYWNYLEAVLPKLAEGGLIAADNTLWSGRVLDPQDDDSRAIADFNERVLADGRLRCVLLAIRDGVTLIRRASK